MPHEGHLQRYPLAQARELELHFRPLKGDERFKFHFLNTRFSWACKTNGIRLIKVPYIWNATEDYVRSLIEN